jgi:chromosome segregation ATPase
MALSHRREIERLEAESARQVEELTLQAEAKEEQLKQALVEIDARQSAIERLTADLDAARGETEAHTMRLREEAEARQQAESQRDDLSAELEFVRSEVLGAEGGRRGLFRRTKPKPASPKRVAGATPARSPEPEVAPLDEDTDALLERRLFGE